MFHFIRRPISAQSAHSDEESGWPDDAARRPWGFAENKEPLNIENASDRGNGAGDYSDCTAASTESSESRNPKRSHPLIIFVGDHPLAMVSSITYLGVQINSDLSWSTNLCNKARQLIYCQFYKHADTKTLLQLYETFIRPHLECYSIVWDSYLAKDTEALQNVQVWSSKVFEGVGSWTRAAAASIKCLVQQESSCKVKPLI